MTVIRNPLLAAQTMLIALVPVTLAASAFLIEELTFDDRWVNNVTGAVALLGAALAACRVWSADNNQRAGLFWFVATIGFSVLAISQWYEVRVEQLERALRIEALDDVLLLLIMPPIILIGVRARSVGRIVKAILLVGFAVHVISTGMDLAEDWASQTVAGSETVEVVVDYSELAFVQLYLVAFALFAAAEILSAGLSGNAARGRILSWRRVYAWHVRPWLWRLAHPGAAPEDYYSAMILKRIHHGRRHAAIGPTARPVPGYPELRDVLIRHGLQPEHTVVDYGCGSFRLGLPIMQYLQPGHYWGLDVHEGFLELGMAAIPPNLAAEKRPQARLIDRQSLADARAAAPDYVVSWHVCSKVPPERLGDYFGKMISLMARDTLILVHFPETDDRKRQSCFSWSESRERISAVIRAIDPTLKIAFSPLTAAVSHGVRQTIVAIRH